MHQAVPFTARNVEVLKKIYLLVFLATFSSNLFCYQDSLTVIDSTYSFKLDIIANNWILTNKDFYAYDVNGHLCEWTSYHWVSEINDWVVESRSV